MFALYSAIALVLLAALLVVGRSRPDPPGRARIAQAMVRGALWAVAVVFPLAAACALVYRFPMPMADYSSGPAAIPGVFLAVVFYGLFGGFPLLLAAGAAAGAAAYAIGSPNARLVHWLVPVSATAVAALDRQIGPW